MASQNSNWDSQLLYQMLAFLKTPEEVELFLSDLCTVKELEQMDQRIHSAVLLMEGKTYAQVCEETGISTVTLSRVSRALRHGSGGYSQLLSGYLKSKKEADQ